MGINIEALFNAVDSMNPEHFVTTYLSEDITFCFGNAAPLVGRSAVIAGITEFFGCIKGIEHTIHDLWHADGASFLTCTVSYVRTDGLSVSMPAAVVMRPSDDGQYIRHYSIYVDQAPLWAAA